MYKLHTIAFGLLIAGGLNWLLEAMGYGIGQFLPYNIAMVIYVLVGLAAIYEIVSHKSRCRHCAPEKSAGAM